VSAARSFVAIELAAPMRAAMLEAGDALKASAHEWAGEKWVAGHNLHLTLQFLGNVERETLSAFASTLALSLAEQPTFDLALAGAKAVPGLRHCRMVWANLADEPSGSCASLAAQVAAVAREFDIECEDRPFRPHVTLVRARRPRALAETALEAANGLLSGSLEFMSVRAATLFMSTLTSAGPVYERFAELPFGAM
jgi:2'-5' RNA ligase